MSDINQNNSELLASGGGDATAAGVRFQAALGALIGAELIAESPFIRRLNLGDAKPLWIKFETEAPVDDILVATDAGGFVAIQAKTSLQLSTKPDSEFAKTIGQLVRHYFVCRTGNGGREWDRPQDVMRDRFLIAVGPKSSKPIRQHLHEGLNARRQPGRGANRTLSKSQEGALVKFDVCVKNAWSTLTSEPITDVIIHDLSNLTFILTYDFEGADWITASTILGTALGDPSEAESILNLLLAICSDLMAKRSGVDKPKLRLYLLQAGAKLRPQQTYRNDVKSLVAYSLEVQKYLSRYEMIEVETDVKISVQRSCQEAVCNGALAGSLLLMGEPGTGKSAVINILGRNLRAQGYDVFELAVDRLSVESLEGITGELGLDHPLLQVLLNWDGEKPGYVLIDALDATRGGKSEPMFRRLISELVSTENRWRVIASIRTFDLRLGQQLRNLFKGKPPVASLADVGFSDVRHIKIPAWMPEELEKLLTQAPALAAVLNQAPTKVKELALVPFNTQLLAELVVSGIESEKFWKMDSQVELLRLYWRHRVESLGIAADVSLRRVVDLMVKTRKLSASYIDVAERDPLALQALLQQGVLTASADQRSVSFRHHILFDYAASRVYMDPAQLIDGTMVFPKSAALGLMLGPAFGFILRELWDMDIDHQRFWGAVVSILRNEDSDPVLRGVAARTAAELPIERLDLQSWANLILDRKVSAEKTVAHVVGAFAVRLEDNEPSELAPWTSFAARMEACVHLVAWPLRTLCYQLVERVKEPTDRANLGKAARALMAYALTQEHQRGLIDSAIGFVADTFDTDPASSRSLLQHVFDNDRFDKFGSEEAPELARKIDAIASVDPKFAVHIYKEIYGRSIHENRDTMMGQSQILSLTSNARQDFEMARHSLGEFFPKFLTSDPEHAVDALVIAVKGYVTREHTYSEEPEELVIEVAGQPIRLIDDYSHIWASDPDNEYRQDAVVLIVAFRNHLLTAAPESARLLAKCIIRENQLAVLWSRLFMVAAQRKDVLGELMWPIATQEQFLISLDTRKDAVGLIAAVYSTKSVEERLAFEVGAIQFEGFNKFNSSDELQKLLLTHLFSIIGVDQLVTDGAKTYVKENDVSGDDNDYRISFQEHAGSIETYYWLKKQDLDYSPNTELIKSIDLARTSLELKENTTSTIHQLDVDMDMIRGLKSAIEVAEAMHADNELCGYAMGILAEGVAKVVHHKELKIPINRRYSLELVDLVKVIAQSPIPRVETDTESNFETSASWGSPAARVDAAEAALDLCSVDKDLYLQLRPIIEKLIVDKHPAVRLATAKRLGRLRDADRPGMWKLAEQMINDELNIGVLDYFAISFFGETLRHDTDKVEVLTLQLYQRLSSDDREVVKHLCKNLSHIIANLWVFQGHSNSWNVIQTWIADPVEHEELLGNSLVTLRNGLILGYDDETGPGTEIRERSQIMLARCVNVCAERMDELWGKAQYSEKEKIVAHTCAKLIDSACSQLFFASGAFKSSNYEDRGLPPGKARSKFLDDIESTLQRIGEVGNPRSIYTLLQLLEFLLPTDPPRIFDLIVHALLVGGNRYGFQYESLGVNLFVRMVGLCLADYRDIFEDDKRREKLIECLEVFQRVGWPAARRLLYRLPDLLR